MFEINKLEMVDRDVVSWNRIAVCLKAIEAICADERGDRAAH